MGSAAQEKAGTGGRVAARYVDRDMVRERVIEVWMSGVGVWEGH